MQYLVTMTTHVPDGVPETAVDDVRAREATRARELAEAGHLIRLWRPPLEPGEWRTLPSPTPRRDGTTEFITTFAMIVPEDVDPEALDAALAAEARDSRQLAEQGYLVRLWRLPGARRALGLWQAEDVGRLRALLAALPLGPWLEIEVVPLSEHPSDPGRTGEGAGRSRQSV